MKQATIKKLESAKAETTNDEMEAIVNSYIEDMKAYNQNLEVLDTEVTQGVKPLQRNVIIRCMTSPNPVQIEVPSDEGGTKFKRMIHPNPLKPIGVVVATYSDEASVKAGDLVQIQASTVMQPRATNVPCAYFLPYMKENPIDYYGYVIIPEHSIETKINKLPDFYAA